MEKQITQRDKIILVDLSSRYTCQICNEILINTKVTNCGHRFCRYCIRLSLHNCLNCVECCEPVLSIKIDESTDRKIDSIFRRGSAYLQQKRNEIVEVRNSSEKEMKERFNIGSDEESCQSQLSKNLHTNSTQKAKGKDYYSSVVRNSKIIENRLFKTYDKLLSQISLSKNAHLSQPSGPKGDHCVAAEEDNAKIEHVAKMAAKTAAEAFQNLSHADDLLQEADDVLGIIDFLKTHSLEHIAQEAESSSSDLKTNVEEEPEVDKGYENIQQILSTISLKKSKATSNMNCNQQESSTSTGKNNTNEYCCLDSVEFASHMKKCQEALQRIRSEDIGNDFRAKNVSSSSGGSKYVKNSCNPAKPSELVKTVKWRERQPSFAINNRIKTNQEGTKLTVKRNPKKSSVNEFSQLKLPPLFSLDNQHDE